MKIRWVQGKNIDGSGDELKVRRKEKTEAGEV